MIYRAAKVRKKRKSCKRLRKKNVKIIVLYVIQHKIGVYYCAREKKVVPLQTTFGMLCYAFECEN